jgi:Ni2+-binding GTPase involved in maturation of urease and hydrogenase
MNFGIFFGCTISIGPTGPKAGGGGGGSYTTSEFLVPFPNKLRQTTRMVLITVNIGERKWRKTYTVLRERAEIIIKVMNLYNTVKDNMYVGVNSFKRASKRVTAIFTRKDK